MVLDARQRQLAPCQQRRLAADLGARVGDRQALDRRDVRFECHCSADRAMRAIRMLGRDAIAEMIEEGAERGGAEVFCEFCTERYLIPLDDLRSMVRRMGGEAA